MNPLKRIHDSLRIVFQRHRLIFWYDADGHWQNAFDAFDDPNITKIRVDGTEFGTKVKIHRDSNPLSCYLLYFPCARPLDTDNWLLDLLLQGHEFKADRASLALQEVGLSYDFREIVAEHVGFFESQKRLEALREHVSSDETPRTVRLKMMAVLQGAAPNIDDLLYGFLNKPANNSLIDKVDECLGQANLIETFWKEVAVTFGYANTQPSLRDFVTTLFRWANPLDSSISLDPHAKVFLQRWKDSQVNRHSFREWSKILEADLRIAEKLATLDTVKTIVPSDTFPLFEKNIIHWLCKAFEKDSPEQTLLPVIQARRSSFWFADHQHGYEALEQAITLRQLLKSAELNVETVAAGINKYIATWHRIDTAYRRCQYHLRAYAQIALMEKVTEWVEKAYVNNYLLPLADRWGDQVRDMATWACEALPSQTVFYGKYVKPFMEKGQKVVVVISDALRYEAAAELTTRLRTESRWTAELDALLGALPSYTQMGMAALLPGREQCIQLPDGTVLVDGKSSAGTENRHQILASALDGKGCALQAEKFLEMNTKTEARALIRDHDVIYIYHNCIDKVGDALVTEARTTEAVEKTLDELEQILRKIANANGNNMLITADHGFMFQQSPVEDDDDAPLPDAAEWLYRDRRFALGKGIVATSSVKLFTAAELCLTGEWTAAFPLALGRFPLRGSGKRYVHGGVSLQEVIVPVLRVHKARVDDTEQVDVDLLRVPSKITTGQVSLALYQDQPVADKVLPRILRVGIFTIDGIPLSEIRTMTFDSADSDPRHREKSVVLTLARAADDYNNQEVEIQLEETISGTTQKVIYRSHRIKLRKPFASDFDDF